jgi:C-terminal processing protease CtpA/Prc
MKPKYVFALACLLLALAPAACTRAAPAEPAPTLAPTPTPALSPEILAEREEVFDIVWGTVNAVYFDPDFGGVDWEAVGEEYRPKVLAAQDELDFYILLNDMCFELGVSHFGVLPPGMDEQLQVDVTAPGLLGLDVRILDDQVVVTNVQESSAAAEAGLRPGDVILQIDDKDMSQAEELVVLDSPPYNPRKALGNVIGAIQGLFFGEVGEERTITYLDGEERQQTITVALEARRTEPFVSEKLPPLYADYEVRTLEGGIAYIRFDGFLPPILDGVLDAIAGNRSAPAMILDIRGNPGGVYFVRKAIASQFFENRTLLWRFNTRPGLDVGDFETVAYTDPPQEAYLGPVVVLVDVMSGSSSEEFSGTMSALGRAAIAGEQTSGSDLVANTEYLPNGAFFIYPFAQTEMPDGTILEGRGVIPDIPAALDRESLLQGRDPQLEAAIAFLLQQIP